ncbi:Uncharacterized membrane protein [Halopelagius inordinatus]|uniref:Uncharacterized membrane protein n=1 Tax=Halopelagius inordinatus TaxID=553467 RepID=A0A1I2UBZ8_9EURY|nr:DUF1616 domain-containing protein [Halopelagius inordinatus]SFG73167.1 Uncharacterized membrane protein [Halopelagius inordinatus]
MSFRERVWPYLPESVRYLSLDLLGVLAAVFVAALAVTVPVVSETPLRAVVTFPFLLFVPGYSFVAAVFPAAETRDEVEASHRQLSNVERVTLSLGSSVAIVPLFGFALNFTPWGFRLVPMLAALGLFSVVCVGLAATRRSKLPEERRFSPPVSRWYRGFRNEFVPHRTQTDAALNVALAAMVLLAVASVGYVLVDQQNGERYTELYLLTENDDGRLVTDGYPTELTATQSRSLVVGVRNHEHEQMSYTVVTKLQRVRSGGGSTTVVEEERLDRFGVALASNESTRQRRVLTPSLTGDRLRLTVSLYRGDGAENPETGEAYRRTHLWVNVTAPS